LDFYICLYARSRSPVTSRPAGGRRGRVSPANSQWLAGPEQDHEQNADHAQHGKNRLIQQDLDDAVPEPGRGTLDPGPERQLAGLMDVVPELAKPGEPQGLVGDKTGAVIDHKDESAGQKQQAD
jgi:hypothetical protein